ncbi:MAG: HPr family phosphocarrier protein [Butyricicoccus sp.]
MEAFEHIVSSPEGVHGRTAIRLVERAEELNSRILVENGARTAHADRLFDLLALGARQGDRLHITVEGKTAQADALRLKEFFKAYI